MYIYVELVQHNACKEMRYSARGGGGVSRKRIQRRHWQEREKGISREVESRNHFTTESFMHIGNARHATACALCRREIEFCLKFIEPFKEINRRRIRNLPLLLLVHRKSSIAIYLYLLPVKPLFRDTRIIYFFFAKIDALNFSSPLQN